DNTRPRTYIGYPVRACGCPKAASARRRRPWRGRPPRMLARCRRPSAECTASCRSAESRVASQDTFAIQIRFAARHVPRIVAVAIELQDQERRLRGLAGKVLDIRIGAALEV